MRLLSLGLLAAALFALPASAEAANVNIDLTLGDGTIDGFGFSAIHEGTGAMKTVDGNVYYRNGGTVDYSLSGVLHAVLNDVTGEISNVNGTLTSTQYGDANDQIIVTDGTIDFGSSAPNTMGANLITQDHGTFYFLDHDFNGPANSADPTIGGAIYLWGNNWDNTQYATREDFLDSAEHANNPHALLGADIGMMVSLAPTGPNPVPEPGSLALFGLGAVGLYARRRRRIAK